MYQFKKEYFKNIDDLQNQLYLQKFTIKDWVKFLVDEIHIHQHLNIFVEVFAEEAIQKAKILDQKIKNKQSVGKLFGVIVSIKDVFFYKGHKVSAASAFLKNLESSYTATAVQKLIDEDAIIIGRVNCDEFAMGASNENSVYGPVKNPHDNSLVTGGSSGGSAASVAKKLCMISLGSDTGGSVRQPADFCGVYGLKPTYGRISRYGLIAYASSLDSVGIFANDIDDVDKILQIISGKDAFDSTCVNNQPINYSITKPLKIAYFNEVLKYEALEPEIKKTFVNVINTFKSKHLVEGIDFELLHYIVPTYYIISCAEASSNLSRYDGIRYGTSIPIENTTQLKSLYKKNRSNGFGEETKRRIMLGNYILSAGYYDAYYAKAQEIRKILIDTINKIFEEYDVIIIPNTPCLPWKIGEKNTNPNEMYLSDIFSVLANLIGSPAIALPITKHSNGLPLGTQIIGKKFSEEQLIEISKDLKRLMSD